MEKGEFRMIVYNSETAGYSKQAIKNWQNAHLVYEAGSWEAIDNAVILENVSVLIVRLMRYVSEEILLKFPNLKMLVSATTGHDHIDLQAISKRNIKLVSLRGEDDFLQTIPSTAEHTWALLLALLRNIPQADRHVEAGNWERDLFRGHQLKHKTIGIIGLGRTGLKVAKYAEAFEMQVCYYDPYVENNDYKKIDQLHALFACSDIISIHVHLNEQTQNMVNSACFAHLNKAIYLINTSRGKVWDEAAIVENLKQNKIKGIATDVLATELNNIEESPLWEAKKDGFNVIITPHLGGATFEAMWQCEEYISNLAINHLN